MTTQKQANLPVGTLRDRLRARADQTNNGEDLDLNETLGYLLSLPDGEQTSDCCDALLQLGRNFHYASRPVEALQAGSRAARLAIALNDKLYLYRARALEGAAQGSLGCFTESAVAYNESWSLARELKDKEREVWAIGNIGTLYAGMGQLDEAMRCYERSRKIAQDHGFASWELHNRNNLADCAVQLREPASGFRALSCLSNDVPLNKPDMAIFASAHNTLARLHLIVGDLDAARAHVERSDRVARLTAWETTIRSNEAVMGLIEVSSGAVEKGLAAMERALAFAKHADRTSLPDHLGMCIDAYETAGHSDKALAYLNELVALNRAAMSADVAALHSQGPPASTQFQADSHFDGWLLAKAHALQADVENRIQRFIEMSVNAEIVGGHDLFRTFRVAKLARYLGVEMGWDDRRLHTLALAAQLSNIGMIGIPARVLQRSRALSASERHLLRGHTVYGGELLRRAKLRVLDIATLVAEQHHERYDGSGYPHGIVGSAICEEARMVAVCDAFDAMTHRRPWRPIPFSRRSALTEITNSAGSQFDPLVVDMFVNLVQRKFLDHTTLDALLAEGADEIEYVRVRARMDVLIGEEN